MRRPPDPRALRERAVQDLRAFERQARDTGIAMEVLRPAHYALCASIDDVVLNTPWGAASGWAGQTLVATFHHGARGTDQFFDQLRQMRKAPDKFLPVIELMYLCLSLGFMGRYRQARGEGELERVRAEAHAAIAAQRTGGRSGAVAALARGRGALPAGARRPAGLGRSGRRRGTVRRAAVLDIHQPERGVRWAAGAGARLASRAHAAGDARGDRAAVAAAARATPNRPPSIGCAPACSRTSTDARSACWARRRRRSSASPTTRCSHRAARSCRLRRCRCWSGSPRRCGTRADRCA